MQLSQLERVCGADLRSLMASRAQKGLSTGLMLTVESYYLLHTNISIKNESNCRSRRKAD